LVTSLYANDSLLDLEGTPFDPILGAMTTEPDFGTIDTIDIATGDLSFTPPAGFTGFCHFNYTVRDKDGTSEPASVRIEVRDTVSAWYERETGVAPTLPDDLTSDGDNDGLDLLTEYAFGLSPVNPETDPIALPRASLVEDSWKLEFQIPYPRLGDINYEIEWSSDLSQWQRFGIKLAFQFRDWILDDGSFTPEPSIVSSEIDEATGTETVTITGTGFASPGSNYFDSEAMHHFRVRAVYVP